MCELTLIDILKSWISAFFEVACDDFVTPFLNVVDLCHRLVRFARLTTNFGSNMQISCIVHKNESNSTFSERKNFLQTNVSPAVCGFSAEILHTVLRFSHIVWFTIYHVYTKLNIGRTIGDNRSAEFRLDKNGNVSSNEWYVYERGACSCGIPLSPSTTIPFPLHNPLIFLFLHFIGGAVHCLKGRPRRYQVIRERRVRAGVDVRILGSVTRVPQNFKNSSKWKNFYGLVTT